MVSSVRGDVSPGFRWTTLTRDVSRLPCCSPAHRDLQQRIAANPGVRWESRRDAQPCPSQPGRSRADVAGSSQLTGCNPKCCFKIS
jgi:hypothetical protein